MRDFFEEALIRVIGLGYLIFLGFAFVVSPEYVDEQLYGDEGRF